MHLHSNTLPGRIECTCQSCGKTFTIKRSTYLTGRGQFCSRPCRSAGEAQPLEQRFWAKVQKTEGCWIWTASKNPKGYGVFFIDKKTNDLELAHRFSYRLHRGDIPDHLRVLHECDNPTCVRPDHLFLGTPADNSQDMVTKSRQRKGEQVTMAKLTDAQAIEIRQRYAAGGISQGELAKEYGISRATLGSLVQGKTWRHLL